jgi:hypothetical protein
MTSHCNNESASSQVCGSIPLHVPVQRLFEVITTNETDNHEICESLAGSLTAAS